MSDLTGRNQSPTDEPVTHHGPSGGAGRVLLAAAIVLLLVAVAGGTTWWMYTRDPAPTTNTSLPLKPSTPAACPGVKLRVVAAPEIAPSVRAGAKTLDDNQVGDEGVALLRDLGLPEVRCDNQGQEGTEDYLYYGDME